MLYTLHSTLHVDAGKAIKHISSIVRSLRKPPAYQKKVK